MRQDWIEIDLGKVCEKAIKVKEKDMPPKDTFIYLDIGGINNKLNRIIDHKIYQWDEAPSRAQQIVKYGDVLFSNVRTYLKNIAQVINPQYEGQICSSGFTVIRGKNQILLPNYIFYFSIFEGFLQPLNEMQTGTSYPAVRDKDVFAQKIPLAPLPEQRAIVAKIEQLLSDLDNGTSNLKTAKGKLEIYRQAVLKKAFEGQLTKANHIKWITLGEVCKNVEYGTSTKSEDEGLVPVLRMGNIQNGRLDWHDLKYTSNTAEIKKYKLQKEDVLFNRTNSPEHVGKTAIYKGEKEAIFAGYLIRIHYKENEVNGDYLNYYLNSHIAKQYGNQVKSFGVNQSNINGTKLKRYPFPKSTLEEQFEIVHAIESRLSVCDKIYETIDQSLEKSEALRQSILKKAFEGKLLSESELEVCRQEHDWEPADKLLERIKKEKVKSSIK